MVILYFLCSFLIFQKSESSVSDDLIVSHYSKNGFLNPHLTVDRKEEKTGLIAWENFLTPWENDHNKEEERLVLLNFVNADIVNVLKYYEEIFHVIFMTDDILQPSSLQGKSLFGSKINFSSHKPLTRKDAWNVLITLLEMAGVTLQPGSMQRVYRVVTLAKDSPQSYLRGPLPTFIGIKEEELPDSDMRIRYVYPIKNMSIDGILNLVKSFQSASSPDPIAIKEMNSVLFVDRVYNIKVILSILNELDKALIPEKMIVIKIKKGNAQAIVDLYKSLIKEETNGQATPRIAGTKRADLVTYFDSQVRLIPELRMNYIIAFGTEESLKKVEDFIVRFQDVVSELPYMPTHVYLLKYTQAEVIANILKQAIGFKGDGDAAKYGGVRNGEKYLSDVAVFPEITSNALLITCSDDDYKYVYQLLQKIDIEQKQVSLNLTIVSIDLEDMKSLGTQLRNSPGAFGKDINIQTGMLDTSKGVVGNYPKNLGGEANTGSHRLLGNLLQLVTGSIPAAGTTVVTLGSDAYGVWGLIKMLVTQTKAKIISNPFVVATNKYPTEISIGETRRIASTTITNANNEQMSYTSDAADLSIKIVPTIQGEFVAVTLDLSNSIFTGPENNAVQSGNKTTRNLNTSVIVPNKSMVAIGGLIVDHNTEQENKVPWLADLPIVGWLFKSKEVLNRKSMLLIFIEPVILEEGEFQKLEQAACQKITAMNENRKTTYKCPIEKSFFKQDALMKMTGYFSKGELGVTSFCPFKSKGNCQIKSLLKKEAVVPNLIAIEKKDYSPCAVPIKKKGFSRHKRKF